MKEGQDSEGEIKYDAIVIGTGISGGWAAKELCENGLKTLVLDRGRMIKHVVDYPTMHKREVGFQAPKQAYARRGFQTRKAIKNRLYYSKRY